MRRVVFLVTSTVLLAPAHSAAQQLGQRIRVLATDVTPTRWVVGDLVAQDGDSLQLRVTRSPTTWSGSSPNWARCLRTRVMGGLSPFVRWGRRYTWCEPD